MLSTRGRQWVSHFNTGFDTGEAVTTSWFERERGGWIRSSTPRLACRRAYLQELPVPRVGGIGNVNDAALSRHAVCFRTVLAGRPCAWVRREADGKLPIPGERGEAHGVNGKIFAHRHGRSAASGHGQPDLYVVSSESLAFTSSTIPHLLHRTLWKGSRA